MMDFCCQIVATRAPEPSQPLIIYGSAKSIRHSHSIRLNTFCIINVFLIPSGDSDPLWYSYSPAYTAFGYQNVIMMITGGLIAMKNEWFPQTHYTIRCPLFSILNRLICWLVFRLIPEVHCYISVYYLVIEHISHKWNTDHAFSQ